MKRIISLTALILLPVLAFADPTSDSTWLVTHYTKHDIYIPMRDGLRLYTAIYEPKDKGSHPILMNRTPYSVGPYGDNTFKAFWNTHYMAYFKEKYIIVLQDVRGHYMSEGDFEDVRPYNPDKKGKETDEASDSWDTIDWLIKHVKNNNGRVGVWGISYPGFYATMAALSGHPALKAVSPQAPVTEWFLGDDFHHNGAFMQLDGFGFYSSFGKPRHQLTKVGNAGFQYTIKDNYKFYLDNPPSRLAQLMGDSIQFWKDIYAHPDYDKWWQVRNTRKWVQYIPPHIATLVVGGLFDAEDCYGAWALYKAIEKKADNNNRLVIGPWSHGGWARGKGDYLGNVRFGQNTAEWYQKNIEIPFFDHYLLHNDENYHIGEATVFLSGANKWKTFSQWPPAESTPVNYYLNADGSLSRTSRSDKAYNSYISDPSKPVPYTEDVHFGRTAEYMTDDQRFASRRPDVLVYQTNTLEHDVTLAGPVTASLSVSISGTDADFVVKLIDVFPDDFTYNDSIDGKGNQKSYPMGGYQMLVRGEIMRGRYRNSFEKPEPFAPDEIEKVKFALPDVAHIFKKGHRIMVQIQSSWFPLADRNPQQFVDIYHCTEKDFLPCTVKIYSTADYPSFLNFNVIKN